MVGMDFWAENDSLLLTEIFQKGIDFKNANDRIHLKSRLQKILSEVEQLHIKKIQIGQDGYIQVDFDVTEKAEITGELGYYVTEFAGCEGLGIAASIERIAHYVFNRHSKELELWNRAKEIYSSKYKNEKLSGRSKAYTFIEIYRDDLKFRL